MIRHMTEAAALYYLYDLRGRPQYLAYGQYQSLLNDIVFLTGWRGRLEKLWLRIQIFYPRRSVKTRILLQHWHTINRALNVPIKACLLWQTDWYKNTSFIGGVSTDERRLFVKAYKQRDDATLAMQQTHFAQHYFSEAFNIVAYAMCQGHVIFYPLLPHLNKHVQSKTIPDKLVELNQNYTEKFDTVAKPALDYIHLNLPALLQKNDQLLLWQRARTYLATCSMLPMVPVHGDVTPWNIFYSDALQPVLIDYERAGWHVPFYDCWHFYCQPLFMKRELPDVLTFINAVHHQTKYDLLFLKQTMLIYLLDQLAHDLQDRDDYPQQHSRLKHVIQAKIAVTNMLLIHLNDA